MMMLVFFNESDIYIYRDVVIGKINSTSSC